MRPKSRKKPAQNAPRRRPEKPLSEDRFYYRPKEVAQVLGIGLTTVYDGVYNGTIPSRKVGDTLLIPAAFVRGEEAQ